MILYRTIDSPVGRMTLTADEHSLLSVLSGEAISDADDVMVSAQRGENSVLDQTEDQLSEYFSGKRTQFELPLAPKGTEFQKLAWEELKRISHGERITYGEQAKRLGRPKSSRAVGAANGKNPIAIIIPCHRVIGASGHLTGYAGGIEMKKLLLDLERST